jgi:hypothetical protein
MLLTGRSSSSRGTARTNDVTYRTKQGYIFPQTAANYSHHKTLRKLLLPVNKGKMKSSSQRGEEATAFVHACTAFTFVHLYHQRDAQLSTTTAIWIYLVIDDHEIEYGG